MKRMQKSYLLLLLIVCTTMQLFSQNIQGIILNNDNNQPVPNAHILLQNSTSGTNSDNNGLFVLNTNGKDNPVIFVSCLGFGSIEMKLNSEAVQEKLQIKLQPTSIQLNNSIVVTATKHELLSHGIPEAVSVLTQDEIKFNAPRSMAEALIGVAGVWVQKTNHGGGSPFIRGLTGNQTLLLTDGIRLNNSTFRYGPNQYFNTIDLFSVERAEVIRGKGSVLYGSDALGGVINVVTRTPEFFSGKSRLVGKGHLKWMNQEMEQSGAAELELQSKNLAVLGNVNRKIFGDLYAGGNLGFERPSGYNETGTHLKAKWRIANRWLMTSAFNHLIQNDVHRYDQVAQRGYETYRYDPQIHHLFYARFEHFGENQFIKKFSFTVSNQFSDETRKYKKNNSAISIKENDVVDNYGVLLDVSSEFNEKWSAVSGVEYYTDRIHSNTIETNTESGEQTEKRGLYPDNSAMKNVALFSQHTLDFNYMKLQFGGRFNAKHLQSIDNTFGEVSLSPESVVGNFSFQYLPNRFDNFILSVNSGFRAPNINDISSFGLFDYGIEIPTQDLTPEKTITVETGYKRLSQTFTFSIFAFRTRLIDQIVRVPTSHNGYDYIDGERVYTKKNVNKSNLYGVEAESGIKINRDFSLLNNITWLYGEDLEKHTPMQRIPPLNGKLALRYNRSRIHSEIEYLFATKQDRLSSGDINDHRIPEGGTPGWQILNLNLAYSLANISIHTGIRNIFNQAYRIHGSGVDGLGRSLWMALRFEIGN